MPCPNDTRIHRLVSVAIGLCWFAVSELPHVSDGIRSFTEQTSASHELEKLIAAVDTIINALPKE